MTVQFQAGVTQVDGVQAPLHDLQRGQLFCHEEDSLPARERLGHQIRNGLRLPGPRGALNHQIAPVHRVDDGKGLGAICIDNLVQIDRCRVVIDTLVLADRRRFAPETLGVVERPQHRMVGRLLLLRPLSRVEILVDQKLAEREEAEVDCVVIHGPPLESTHSLRCSTEILSYIQVILGGHFRQVDAEVVPEFRF